LRKFIVNLIFSEEFEPVASYWQISGDFIKVLSLVISAINFWQKGMIWHII
jgi:hypothetical protein